MAHIESQPPESESESIATAGTFVERTDKVIAAIPDAAGFEGLDVTIVFRREIDAARRQRCFFCILRGDQIRCIEVSCSKTRPVPAST